LLAESVAQEEAKITKKLSKPKLTEAEQEVKALRDAFDLFDVDGSGDIDRSEFKNLMKVGGNY
jgi:Ca2+-binding EF-hand superfamily protein